MNQTYNEPTVFRQVAFPVPAFDYLKAYQRGIERQTGQHLNNNQVLARILAEHQKLNESSGEQNEDKPDESLQGR